MIKRLKTSSDDYKCGFLYPFIVAEKSSDGERQYARTRTHMHGFEISTDCSIFDKLFSHEDDGGIGSGARVYEIRVKNHSGEWQDWQAIVEDIQICLPHASHLEKGVEELFNKHQQRFQKYFEIRYSGILWRSPFGDISIIDEELKLIKKVNPFTLAIEYQIDFDNNCYTLKQQFKDQKKFQKKYYAYDEDQNRL